MESSLDSQPPTPQYDPAIDQPKVTFGQAIIGLLAGAIPMFFLCLLVAMYPFRFAFGMGRGGMFSELGTTISVIYFLAPVTVVFLLLGRIVKDWLFTLYPIIIFGIGSANTSLFLFMSGMLPIDSAANETIVYGIAVLFWYMSVYFFMRPVHYMVAARSLPGVQKRAALVVYGTLCVISIIIPIGLLVAGGPLYTHQQRDRAAIHVPSTAQYISSLPQTNGTHQRLRVANATTTKQLDGTYQVEQAIDIIPLKEWWNVDTSNNCGGNQFTLSSYPGQIFTNKFATTPRGIHFTTATIQAKTDSANLHTIYRYCWVTGASVYTLEIDDIAGLDYLKQYPVTSLIDAITSALPYVPRCSEGKLTPQQYKPQWYCTEADKKQAEAIEADSQKRYKVNQRDVVTSAQAAAEAEAAKPKSFPEVGRLQIPEWGISFPLTHQTKDAYIIADSANPKEMIIGLRSYDSDTCIAGQRYANGKLTYGFGVAHILRDETSRLQTLPGFKGTTPSQSGWVTIGEYSYSLSANSGTACKEMSPEFKRTLSDIFTWAQSQIR